MFDQIIEVGGSLVLRSKMVSLLPDRKAPVDHTNLNILSANQDRLLHISVRRTDNMICFNAREAAGAWGKEERVSLFRVFQQPEVTITIRSKQSVFIMFVDGVIVHTFVKRIYEDVKGISYDCKSTSVFTDPIQLIVMTPKAPTKMLIVSRSFDIAGHDSDMVFVAGFWSNTSQRGYHVRPCPRSRQLSHFLFEDRQSSARQPSLT
jgi:hypothetical protein